MRAAAWPPAPDTWLDRSPTSAADAKGRDSICSRASVSEVPDSVSSSAGGQGRRHSGKSSLCVHRTPPFAHGSEALPQWFCAVRVWPDEIVCLARAFFFPLRPVFKLGCMQSEKV